MKKTLILMLALGSFAVAAEQKPITLSSASDFTWIAGNNSGIGVTPTATNVEKLVKAALADATSDIIGWFGGTGQNYGSSSYGSDITISSGTAFSFKCRPALAGEYVAVGAALPEAAKSITLSFTADNKIGYSLWSVDNNTNTVTELIPTTGVTT